MGINNPHTFMDLVRLRNNLRKLDVEEIAVKVFDDLDEFISDLNRAQLYRDGQLSDGTEITPEYKEITVFLKEMHGIGKSKITDHVTLYDTGKLHKSIFSTVLYPDLILDSKDSKVDKLTTKYGEFLGLTDKSLEILKKKAIPIILGKINEQILR